jgi:hypothetical protein
MDDAERIAEIVRVLTKTGHTAAQDVAGRHLPLMRLGGTRAAVSARVATRIFRRDGFRCRYSGERLVYPGALRLLGELLPDVLPYHPNGKLSESHLIHWTLYASVDHVQPVQRGGSNEESNLVTTSMARNGAKSHWTLEELGWRLLPLGSRDDWDGLLGWYVKAVRAHPDLMASSFHRRWVSSCAQDA